MSNEFDNWEDEPPEPITNIYTPDPLPPPDNGDLSLARSLAEQVSETITRIDNIVNSDPGASPPPELPKEDPAANPAVVAQVQKCTIDRVLPTSVINLIKVAPQNNTVRAVILAHLNITIPDDCVSYAQIKKWIEFNYDPPELPGWPSPAPASPRPVSVAPRPSYLSISFEAAQPESGTADYSVVMRGSGSVELTEQDIIREADESDTWEDFMDSIRDLMDDSISNNVSWIAVPEPDQIDGGYEYSNHEASDNDEFNWSWNQREVKANLRVLLDRISPGTTSRLDSEG
jgi:hypothetical protein